MVINSAGEERQDFLSQLGVAGVQARDDLLVSSMKAEEAMDPGAKGLARLQSLRYGGVQVQVHPILSEVLEELLAPEGLLHLQPLLGVLSILPLTLYMYEPVC